MISVNIPKGLKLYLTVVDPILSLTGKDTLIMSSDRKT